MQIRWSAALASVAMIVGSAGTGAFAQAPTAAPVPVGSTPAPMSSGASTAPAPAGPAVTMMPMPAGMLALDARVLRARRTATGFTLSGQALVKDACQGARFDIFAGNIYPPQFNLVQFRRPDAKGLLCAQHVQWVTAQPRAVRAAKGQMTVTVHTQRRPSMIVRIR